MWPTALNEFDTSALQYTQESNGIIYISNVSPSRKKYWAATILLCKAKWSLRILCCCSFVIGQFLSHTKKQDLTKIKTSGYIAIYGIFAVTIYKSLFSHICTNSDNDAVV